MSIIEECTCTSVREFIERLRPSNAEWLPASRWVFRGQASAEWALLPSAWRTNTPNAIASYLQHSPYDLAAFESNGNWNWRVEEQLARNLDRVKSHLQHILAERDIIRAFGSFARRLGFPVDSDIYPIQWRERLSWSDIEAYPYLYPKHNDPQAQCFYLKAGLAQHHGLPTRLLDWSYNGVTAAYFAAAQDIGESDGSLVVWALLTELHTNDVKNRIALLDYPPHRHEFLKAQRGLFTIIENADVYYAEHGVWSSIESTLIHYYDNKSTEKPALKKITLPRGLRGELLEYLWNEEVTLAHMMPSYDSIASTLKLRWKSGYVRA